ncbi:MAG: SPOR domain-containing protein [Bacteroidota bacterium]
MKSTLLILLVSASTIFSQPNIVPALKDIEKGDLIGAKTKLGTFLGKYPTDPSVKFLDAVLTENGVDAVNKYTEIFTKYPQNQFADAALYRTFSYYYSLGIYKKADGLLSKLKNDYPNSPYIKAADRTVPSEDIYYKSVEEDEPESKPIREVVAEKQYSIQAGAFLNKTNAQNLKKRFQKDGLYSSIFPKEVGGSLLNVVIVGKYSSKEEANKQLSTINKKYKLSGRVITVNQ